MLKNIFSFAYCFITKTLSPSKVLLLLVVAFFIHEKDVNAQGVIPTKGKDFWFGFMENAIESAPTKRLDVFVTSNLNTSGTISVPGQGWSLAFNVTANVTTTLTIPNNVAEHLTTETVEGRGVHIVTLDTVSVFAINFEEYTADGTQVYPTQSLGIGYRISSYRGLSSSVYGVYPSEFVIVATEDGTQIKITPTAPTWGGRPANVPFYVNLNQGQSYQVKAVADVSDFTGTTIEGTDSSGTCRPFAVFSGTLCANIPQGCYACDHIYDECLPTRVWGKEYYASPFSFATSYTLRVLADQSGTTFTINGGPSQSLNAGQFFEQNSVTTPSCVIANKPISVIQYMEGITCSGAGDPSMLYLNAADQKIDNVTFSTVTSAIITQHVVNVIMSAAYINQLTLDGLPVASSFFSPFPSCPSIMYAQLDLVPGSHTLNADSGFTAYVYGTGSAESYAYSVGAFSKRSPIVVDSILCTTDTVHIGTSTLLYNAWWSTQTNMTDTIALGQVLTLTPPIIPDMYVLHGDELISGCPSELYFSVEVPSMPGMWIAQSEDTVCKYQSVQLTSGTTPPSSIYLYSWSPAIDLSDPNIPNPVANPSASRWYVLSISSPTGCGGTIKDSIYITVKNGNISSFNVMADDTGLCVGESAQLNMNVEANVIDDAFDPGINSSLWSSTAGGIASNICGSVTGNAIYFNAAGTRELTTVPINVTNGGTIKFWIKIANGIAPCDDADPGENVVLEYTINGGGAWNNIATYNEASYPVFTLISVPIPAGAYSATTQFRWRQVIHSGMGQDNWLLDNVLVGAVGSAGYVFSWTPSQGLSGSTIPNPVATPGNTVLYVGTAVDNTTGCIYTDSVNINVNPNFTLAVSNDTSLCQVTGIQLSAVPNTGTNYSYVWTPAAGLSNVGISNPVATPSSSTLYSVLVTSQYGCTQSATVNIDVLSHTTFNVIPDTTSICFGDTIQANTQMQSGCGVNGSVCGGTIDSTSINSGGFSSNQDDITPFSGSWESARRQLLFKASELTSYGMNAGTISGLSFTVQNFNGPVSYDNFTIKIGCTNLNQLTTNFVTGLSTVFNPQSISVTNGGNTFVFNSNYDWDGVSNLIVEICYENLNPGFSSTIYYDFGPGNCTLTSFGVSNECNTATGNLNSLRPNIVFKHCSTPAPAYVIAWTPSSSVSNPAILNPQLTPTISTTYYITATDPSTGCVLRDSLPVIVGVSNLQASVMNDTTVCSSIGIQLSVTHSGSGSVIYNWQPAASLNNPNTANPTIAVDGSQQYILYLTDSANCSGVTDTVNIDVNGYPVISMTSDTVACSGDTIHLFATGGTNVTWSPAAGLNNPNSPTPTTVLQAAAQYHVTVTDNFGCSSIDSVDIQISYRPVITLGNDTSFCRGGQAILMASGVANFTWQDGSTNISYAATETGTYWVDATNQCGADRDSVDVIVHELPVVDIGNDTSVCTGSTVVLDAGNPGSHFNWSTTDSTQTISPTIDGTYQVTVTDNNNCTSSDNATITFLPLPVVSIGNDTTICDGSDLSLDAGNPGSSYAWSTGENTQIIVTSTPGNISVDVTDANGCKSTDRLQLFVQPLPQITVTNNSDLCLGDSMMLDANAATGTTYQWSPTTDLNTPGAASTWAKPLVNTMYSVHVTDVYGCADDASVYIHILLTPNVQLGNDTSICLGKEVTFHAGPSFYSYLWNTGSTQNEITVNQEGNYWVNVSNQCGTVADSVSILKLYELPQINLGSGGRVCENTPVILDAGNPGSHYIWTTGATTQMIVPSVTGNYGVSVTDTNNCSSSMFTSIEIVRLPHLAFEPEVWLCPGEQLVLNAKSDYGTYLWQDGSTYESYAATQAGIYWVHAENFCGDDADTVTVGQYDCQCEFYVPNAFTPNTDGKNESFLPLTVCSVETYDLKIYNRWGVVVFESTDLTRGWDGSYSGSAAPEAVYTYLITYTGHANSHYVSDRLTGIVTLLR